jgi:hypothetical protein
VLAAWSHADDDNVDISLAVCHFSSRSINPRLRVTAAGNVSAGT